MFIFDRSIVCRDSNGRKGIICRNSVNEIGNDKSLDEVVFEAPVMLNGGKFDLQKMGAFSYTMGNSMLYNISEIGRYVHIGINVVAGVPESDYSRVLMSPVFAPYKNAMFSDYSNIAASDEWRGKMKRKTEVKINKIEIGNDVFIGNNVIIKPGIKIGDGAVIGAGCIVSKDIEPYSIVEGPGCEIRGMRFCEEIVEELLKIKWWNYAPDLMRELDYTEPKSFIENLRERVEKSPKKYYGEFFAFNSHNKTIERVDASGHRELVYKGW